ncbi:MULTISPECIES: serine hydrolase [unclassified Streptomyces]|uniref:serine hydrolase domain-containing protein n=1 Tax=unclassified Streptomyces TaxID=2593676 RepID=UPI0022535CD4|nr:MULTISPECIES: serine hydrolase domain-containing protein [unclassified Streptomyces]MCX4990906.1 beta-lactamase family protein [Streptomyces sp. NBC_00568]MCX5003863.1 beta-lactamase family protein [Streptomyces sp. NBC_00638]
MRVRTGLVGATAVAIAATLAGPAVAAPAKGDHGRGHHAPTRQAVEAAVRDGVPGVTATAEDRHGAWSATAGVGDLRTGAPRSAADRYRVGSITKTFVSTVLLQLEAEGRLSLDDTVDHWLPGVVRGNGNDGTGITLRQLLNHTSGIFNYTADEDFGRTYFLKDGFLRHRYDTSTPGQLVAIALSHKPDFAPGTSWNYSNTNYVLAGMVIEKATGRSYAAQIRERIIEPLGLHATSVPGTRVTVPRPSSRAYSKLAETTSGPTYDVTTLNPTLASSAGEMISDNADLNRFYTALLRGRLLPREQLTEMRTTVEVDGIPNARYGLGLIDRELSCGVHVWGHDGGIHGSVSSAVTTADGRHSLALNFNGDWSGDSDAVIEAEFCGK